MGRILALDVGEKRVGVAISDPLGYSAQPLLVLPRRPHADFLKALDELCNDYEVSLVLLGLPRRTSGEKGPEAQRVLALASEIKNKLKRACDTWDEWLSTVAAERVLLEGDVRRDKRKKVIDKTAAAIILDGYLNYLAHGKKHDR